MRPRRRGRREGRTAPRCAARRRGPARRSRPCVVAASGTNGMTSTAPIRGCSPACDVHVDLVDRGRHQPLERVADRAVLAGHREHRAVVARVARPVEQVHAGTRLDRLGQPVDDLEPPALGDVRDGLDQHPSMLDAPQTCRGSGVQELTAPPSGRGAATDRPGSRLTLEPISCRGRPARAARSPS